MPSEAQETPLDLKSFVELLGRLGEHGIPFAVIGGMAVGAYARLRGETIFSADLDIVTTQATLQELIDIAPVLSLEVLSRPQPRSVPVAVMKWRGLEVNVLTASSGLPDAEFVVRGAREFQLNDPPVVIPIADPLDLLGNKLMVRRPKDLPHIDVLRRFVEDEIFVEFTEGATVRERLASLRRYLDVLGTKVLPVELARRLVDMVEDPVSARYLAGHLGDAELARALLERMERRGAGQDVREILARRGLIAESIDT